jgi:hypothetical protein
MKRFDRSGSSDFRADLLPTALKYHLSKARANGENTIPIGTAIDDIVREVEAREPTQ